MINFAPDFGIHKAIVIDNYDEAFPMSGRVQVFVPDIHSVNLIATFKGTNISEFTFPGNNIRTSLTPDVLDNLKSFCPWASPMTPIASDIGPGFYNASDGTASITENDCVSLSARPSPASNYESLQSVLNTAGGHANPAATFVSKANPLPWLRTPSLTNKPNGVFSVPRVGATLLVQFFDGNPNFPVYLGSLPNASEFSSIMNAVGLNGLDDQTAPRQN